MIDKNLPKIIISPDNMKATLSVANDTALTATNIRTALDDAGVAIPIDEELLQSIVNKFNRGENIAGILVAEGVRPRPGKEGELIPLGNFDFPVFPGDVFAILKDPSPAIPGMDILGKELLPPGHNRAVKSITVTKSGTVTQEGEKIIALRYGLANTDYDGVNIVSLMTMSEDLMSLSATIYSHDFMGNKVSLERIVSAVKAMGIRVRPNLVVVEEALEKPSPVENIPVCSGLKPFKGDDGWLENVISQSKKTAGALDKHGNIDYRNRGSTDTVVKGQTIAVLHPPTKGRPGRTLLGTTIEAEDGAPAFIELGENVSLSEEGEKVTATVDGLASIKNGRVSVSEVYTVKSDVDMHTGHVIMNKGSISIDGSVLSGFHISCPGNIIISGTVEDCILTAGENIQIARGIVMNENGFVRALGNVSALFAIGTNIHAGGNVYIHNDVNLSSIIAEGSIFVTGSQGKVIGGLLHCGKEIHATQIGSELGAATEIRLGIDDAFIAEYQNEHTRLKGSLDFIASKIGSGNDDETIAKYPPEKLPTVKHILDKRESLKTKMSELGQKIILLQEEMSKPGNYALKVTGKIFPGTVIHYRNKSLPIVSTISASKITFDPSRGNFVISSHR